MLRRTGSGWMKNKLSAYSVLVLAALVAIAAVTIIANPFNSAGTATASVPPSSGASGSLQQQGGSASTVPAQHSHQGGSEGNEHHGSLGTAGAGAPASLPPDA